MLPTISINQDFLSSKIAKLHLSKDTIGLRVVRFNDLRLLLTRHALHSSCLDLLIFRLINESHNALTHLQVLLAHLAQPLVDL